MEFCQGFLLQNMVALLTYDDSVKRLLFAKKIPNHDVLTGLLQTLQTRIKSRQTAITTSTPTNSINSNSNKNNNMATGINNIVRPATVIGGSGIKK